MPRIKEVFIVTISLGFLLCLLYYHPFMHNFWLFDDPFILRCAVEHPWWAYFFDPQTWNFFSSAHFTPMVVLSYALDYRLFGLAPEWFYLHSLISLWVVCVLLYFLMRGHIPIWAALFGVLFFILSKPFAAASEILMLRHYIEGALFSCLAALLFLSALKNDSMPRAGWAAFFYLLAMLCKEVYIPLPLLLCLVPQGHFRQRIKMGIVLSLGLLIYLGWRLWMLGAFIGGFSGSLMASGSHSGLASLLSVLRYLGSAAASFNGLTGVTAACLGLLLTVSMAHQIAKKNFSPLIFAVAGLTAVIVPLLPIAPYLRDSMIIAFRFSFAAVLVFSVFLAWAAANLPGIHTVQGLPAKCSILRLMISILLTVLITNTSIQSQKWVATQRKQTITPLSAEGRFVWQEDQPGVLVRSHNMFSILYYQNLNYFKTQIAARQPLLVIADGYGLVSDVEKNLSGKPKYFAYNRERQEISEVSSQVRDKREEMLSLIADSQFAARLEVDQGSFALDLETSQEQGKLILLIGYMPGMYCDAFPFPGQTKVRLSGTLYAGLTGYFRFGQHNAERGTISLSPEWWVDFSQTQVISWPQ